MVQENKAITQKDFIDAFTARPADAEAMIISELSSRLDIITKTLKESVATRDKRLPVTAANCLRGALIRCTQTINDPEITAKVNELVAMTAKITGI